MILLWYCGKIPGLDFKFGYTSVPHTAPTKTSTETSGNAFRLKYML
jgi:hypothetical protein